MQKPLVAFFSLVLSSMVVAKNAVGDLPLLPEPVTNNAVASVMIGNKQVIVTMMGLGAKKDHSSVHNKAWQLELDKNTGPKEWKAIPNVPSSLPLKGRLASVAAGLNSSIYLFGGYTVAPDHTEISTPDVYRYDITTSTYSLLTPMPVPVDDAVAVTYMNRYIYLISGWHNDGNVNLVQIYDTQNETWQQGSPYLGAPVFGHAGGIVGNTMVICDGVATVPRANKRRTFAAETACYKGVINQQDHTKIDWTIIDHPTGQSRYRMAAAGDDQHNQILFVGGSINPYNYNGIGYDGNPSEPSNQIWQFDLDSNQWHLTTHDLPTMDHRGLLKIDEKWAVLGGMTPGQVVSQSIHFFTVGAL